MSKEFQKYKDITPEQIATWKKTKGQLWEETIPVSDDGNEVAKFVVCKPTRNVLDAMTSKADAKDIDGVNKLLISNCVLGGDMVYLDREKGDLQIFLTIIEVLGKFLEPRKATSKKL